MTDNLRDRIAAVLYGNLRRQQGIDRPDRFLDWIDTSELADAIIADLGLQRASKPNDYDHVQYPPGDRYITDWITNG